MYIIHRKDFVKDLKLDKIDNRKKTASYKPVKTSVTDSICIMSNIKDVKKYLLSVKKEYTDNYIDLDFKEHKSTEMGNCVFYGFASGYIKTKLSDPNVKPLGKNDPLPKDWFPEDDCHHLTLLNIRKTNLKDTIVTYIDKDRSSSDFDLVNE